METAREGAGCRLRLGFVRVIMRASDVRQAGEPSCRAAAGLAPMLPSRRSSERPFGDLNEMPCRALARRCGARMDWPELGKSTAASGRSASCIRNGGYRSRSTTGRAGGTRISGTVRCRCVRARDCEDGGDRGIRTLDRALQPYNGLANRRLQPLGHISVTAAYA